MCSPDCHLCLANYNLSSLNNQKCSFISSHHATIFYDDWTQHYELINYNEYGTRVDGIIYGNDIDRKLIYIPESSDLVHRVRNLIKTAPKKLSSNYETSSVISELCASPPKRLMKMLSKRHELLFILFSTWMTMNNSSTQSPHESPVLLTDSLSVVTKDFLKLSKSNNLLVH
ncbi:unnamed protein product [Schistosoma bovis]|nr:unnamed protein product [Schistosoma bovis]